MADRRNAVFMIYILSQTSLFVRSEEQRFMASPDRKADSCGQGSAPGRRPCLGVCRMHPSGHPGRNRTEREDPASGSERHRRLTGIPHLPPAAAITPGPTPGVGLGGVASLTASAGTGVLGPLPKAGRRGRALLRPRRGARGGSIPQEVRGVHRSPGAWSEP